MATRSQSETSVISQKTLDYPSQRLYAASLAVLCQGIKVIDIARYLFSSNSVGFSLCTKWLLVDTILVLGIRALRIPKLDHSKSFVGLILLVLGLFNIVVFGGVSVNGPNFLSSGFSTSHSDNVAYTSSGFDLLSYVTPLTFGLIPASWTSRDGHLVGQHTVRMSPISTARINPQNLNFCLNSPSSPVLIPVLLNNTEVSGIRYTLTHLGSSGVGAAKVERHSLSAREIRAILKTQEELLQVVKPANPPNQDEDDYDEYDDDEEEKENPRSNLEKSQKLIYLQVSRPGVIRLEQVTGSGQVEARIAPGEVVVVPCPTVSFPVPQGHTAEPDIQCAGQDNDRALTINIFGVQPLSLRWSRSANGHKEQFLVEGIEGDRDLPSRRNEAQDGAVASPVRILEPGSVQIPLTVTLNSPGTYTYSLEEVIDSVGNTVKVGPDPTSGSFTRSFVVLTRPSISFAHCSLENPKALLIGSEASLSVRAVDDDPRDGPWEISLKYQPHGEDLDSKKRAPWDKVVHTHGNRADASITATAPGQYTIAGIKGKYCTGTVLAPSTCKVVERPRPSAEIEWKRIHECSGDTGVSANLILRGTPPFQIYYRVQRDKEPTREYSKQFTSSRGEFTVQPERSGHYIFSFSSLSDANYRKVELNGPSIEQIIHPLASADFADSHLAGKSKRAINSCSGSTVDVDVDLKGTGPWNLDVQVIGPHSSDNLHISSIESSRKTLQIPIPPAIMENGGQFEIALVSVEDVYKCKRSLSVPGIVVNVKRTRPTVRFYGSEEERQMAITQNEDAKLPLRLTGSGPWTVKYHRVDTPERTLSARVSNPNDHLSVQQAGMYEIVSVSDSQCPGTVHPEGTKYRVDWIPRPTAKLSSDIVAQYISHNNSHILKPICEGMPDHVDLELTGRPPFQIMYNIAQGNEHGGSRLIDQPTINSIQPRTRFQLLTSAPGHVYYEVKEIGDSVYPLEKSSNSVIPRSQRLLFEQEVAMRPAAYFKNRNRMSYCLHDTFTSLDASSADGVVVLEGRPPFTLTLTVKNVAASTLETLLVEIPSNIWKVDLPSYTFASVGPHRVTIDSVTDSSNCAPSALDPLKSSVWVDVAETAAIIPFDNRPDVCVGEMTQFQLEGIPPWTVGYHVNSRSYTKEVKTSPFSIVHQQPGEFTVSSIAHQQQMCKAAVTDLRFKVHELPSARVGQGQKIYQDIHEGDQAEIVFTLIGEPPFTFTYQRAEASPRKGAKPGRVLETHTVSRVMTHEYSIFSALEGTWTVTSISDKYCRYPPVQQELSADKQKP